MDMVMADLERANEKASAAERENDKLKHQLTNLTANLTEGHQTQRGADMEQAIEILQRSNLEAELAAKEKEVKDLYRAGISSLQFFGTCFVFLFRNFLNWKVTQILIG